MGPVLSLGQKWSPSLSIRVQPWVRFQPRVVVECEGWGWMLEAGLGFKLELVLGLETRWGLRLQ